MFNNTLRSGRPVGQASPGMASWSDLEGRGIHDALRRNAHERGHPAREWSQAVPHVPANPLERNPENRRQISLERVAGDRFAAGAGHERIEGNLVDPGGGGPDGAVAIGEVDLTRV